MGTDYPTVTEVPGNKVTRDQLARTYHRYHTALKFCEGKDVLKVGCGAGQGLGYLARRAKRVIGGDHTEYLLKLAQEHYGGRVELLRLDAHTLPFKDSCFDVVILFEAIYYLAPAERFVEEVHRVLRKDGVLLVCTVNKDWSDFNPSPYSTKYFSVPESFSLLNQRFFGVKFYGAFPVSGGTVKDSLVSLIKRAAIHFHLIPKTIGGKEIFKRIFFGKLSAFPPELEDGMAEYSPPVPIPCDSRNFQYKVLYAVARVQ